MKFNPQILIFLCFLSIYFCRNSLKQNINTSKLVNSTFKISKNHWSTKAFCFSKIDFYIFDLYKLGYLENFSINDEKNQSIYLQFCKNKVSNCSNDKKLFSNDKHLCKRFSGLLNSENNIVMTYDLVNRSVLTMSLPLGDYCNKTAKYQTNYEITCDLGTELTLSSNQTFNSSNCINTIKMRSKYGNVIKIKIVCQNERFIQWWNNIGCNEKVISIILIIIGLYLCFFGSIYNKNVNLLMINSIIFTLLIYATFNLFLDCNILLCFFIGFMVTLIFNIYEMIKIPIVGLNLGFFFANLCYVFILKILDINLQTLYWCDITFFVIVVPIACGFLKDTIYQIFSSLFGGYLFIRVKKIIIIGNIYYSKRKHR